MNTSWGDCNNCWGENRSSMSNQNGWQQGHQFGFHNLCGLITHESDDSGKETESERTRGEGISNAQSKGKGVQCPRVPKKNWKVLNVKFEDKQEFEWVKQDLIIDSGTVDSIAGKKHVDPNRITETRASKAGIKYNSADGGVIKNLGEAPVEARSGQLILRYKLATK